MRIEELLVHFRRQREWTRRLVAAVPEERFDWAPSERDFSCGGLVRHMIQSEVFWRRLLAAAARGERYDPFGLTGTQPERYEAFREPNLRSSRHDRYGASFAALLDSWLPVQAETERELGRLTEEELQAEVHHPIAGLRLPIWEMVLLLVGHEVHHRGQLSAYLKVLGLPQPVLYT
jgi:uncharacterized damage-inducible protein DinB